MHYYKRNLGDYAKKAGRLSMLQHGSYTLLIDACYDREQFPTLDDAIEWTWASTTEEVEAVTFVLRKFFTLENGVYVQKRIQEEIAEYHAKAETNRRIANDRETKRKENNTNRTPSVAEPLEELNEPPPNHKPLTNNQEPKEGAESNSAENCNSTEVKKNSPPASANPYGEVAKALVQAGMQNLNPTHPTFTSLIDEGATAQEFVNAYLSQKASKKQANFQYVIAKVSGMRVDAKANQADRLHGVMPQAPPSTAKQVHIQTADDMLGMFKNQGEQYGRIIELSDYRESNPATDRPLIS